MNMEFILITFYCIEHRWRRGDNIDGIKVSGKKLKTAFPEFQTKQNCRLMIY